MPMFNVNTPFWQFLNKMADEFLLSLLWLLCSIPVITFGASSTAFVSASMKLHRNCETSVTRDFFSAFKQHFLRATLMWLSQAACFLILALDLWLCWQMKTKTGAFLLPVLGMLALLGHIASLYTWPLISNTKCSLLKVWKLAAHLTTAFLPHSLSMLVLEALGCFVAFMHPSLAIAIPFIVCYQFARVYAWTFSIDPLVKDCLNSSSPCCCPGVENAEHTSPTI